jgi:holo-[acyl-carrier protein] synthase
MILGIGNDIVDIRRIEKLVHRFGDRFLNRCFTPAEIQKANSREGTGTVAATLARRFAAKEACSKALGSGISMGVAFRDIEVVNDDEGRPLIKLHGGALRRLEKIIPPGSKANIHLSLSDEPPIAHAFVVIEAVD